MATNSITISFWVFHSISEGYRTIRPGTKVKFEVVERKNGLAARNIQQIE
jgi:cold shock CspA family protein